MTHDDDRIAHLMGEPAGSLDGADRAALDDLHDLLADPAVWASPPEDLEDRVVRAIAEEAAPRPGAEVVPLRRRRPRTRWVVVTAALAAAVVAAVLAGPLLRSGPSAPERYVALGAVGAQGASGSATLTRTGAGWRVELQAAGLPRLDDGAYYEAWLKSAAGVLVPLGTFNEGGHVTLWAGVSPSDYPTFTVTAEAADGNQASSGHQVLAGSVSPAKK